MYTYYVSVGSNIGNRKKYITTAFQSLQKHEGIYSLLSSSLLETEPWGYTDQPVFINAVWQVISTLEPHTMLKVLQQLEQEAERERTIHWGPRTLDLDIIYALQSDGSCVVYDDPTLQLPHPYFWERLFVLQPLQELVPQFTYEGETIGSRIAYLVLHK